MFLLITLTIIILGLYIGFVKFNKTLINPLTMHLLLWGVLIVFYELKLISYPEINPITWVVVILSLLSFVMGVIVFDKNKITPKTNLLILDEKLFKYILILGYIFAVIGLAAAIQNWIVLIKKFGSIINVLVSANIIYSLRVKGEIEGIVPYFSIFSFVALILSALYSGKTGKINLLTILSFVGIILKEMASVGRIGLVYALFLFGFTVFVIRIYDTKKKIANYYKVNKIIIIKSMMIFAILISTATLIKLSRHTFENYKSTSYQLKEMSDGVIISPSIYLYLSSHLGVLNKFLILDKEESIIGGNTFLPVYNILNKLSITKKLDDYQEGYFIPMWTNTGTYLREIYSDFGIFGIIIIPFLLAYFITRQWFDYFINGDIISLLILLYLSLTVFISPIMMATRLAMFPISFVILFVALITIKRKMNG